MRLIDADALKKQWSMADKCEDCPQDARLCQFDQQFTRMDICEMLDEAPTVGGWVSVKDRLPEKQIPVLVYVPPHISGQDEYIGYVGMAYYTKLGGGWWAGTDGAVYGAIGFIHEPTHWMPLPEPPEEVKSDG